MLGRRSYLLAALAAVALGVSLLMLQSRDEASPVEPMTPPAKGPAGSQPPPVDPLADVAPGDLVPVDGATAPVAQPTVEATAAPAHAGGLESAAAQGAPAAPWQPSLAAARAQARARNRVILVYLGTNPATCPPCARLDRQMFSSEGCARLAEQAILWKARTDLPSIPAEDLEAIGVWNARVLPTLLIVTSELGVLHRQQAALYPAYSRGYEALDELQDELSLPDLVELLVAANQRAAREARRLGELSAEQGVEALTERAQLLAGQERWREARQALEQALLRRPDAALEAELAMVVRRSGQGLEAVGILRSLLARHGQDPRSVAWELRLLSLELEQLGSDADSSRRRVLLAQQAGALALRCRAAADLDGETQARLLAAELLVAARQEAAVTKEADALLALVQARPAGAVGSSWLWRLSQLQRQLGHAHAAHQLAERLYREHPASFEAQVLKHGLLDDMRREAATQDGAAPPR